MDNQDELILEQQRQIMKDISEQQLMIDAKSKIDNLLGIYENAELPGFVPGIRSLSKAFLSMRKVRGDGNCFYRAFLFSYLDLLLLWRASADEQLNQKAENERLRLLAVIKNSFAELVALGYSEFAIEYFYDEIVDLVENLFSKSESELLEVFQAEGGQADVYTWFMRLLTAGYLKKESERFVPFLEGNYFDIETFCKQEVEPMNKECEQLQIIALTEYLGVTVSIAYLDGRLFDEAVGLPSVQFPEPGSEASARCNSDIVIYLLYRPGHYDILYKQ